MTMLASVQEQALDSAIDAFGAACTAEDQAIDELLAATRAMVRQGNSDDLVVVKIILVKAIRNSQRLRERLMGQSSRAPRIWGKLAAGLRGGTPRVQNETGILKSLADLKATLEKPVQPIFGADGMLIGARRVDRLERE